MRGGDGGHPCAGRCQRPSGRRRGSGPPRGRGWRPGPRRRRRSSEAATMAGVRWACSMTCPEYRKRKLVSDLVKYLGKDGLIVGFYDQLFHRRECENTPAPPEWLSNHNLPLLDFSTENKIAPIAALALSQCISYPIFHILTFCLIRNIFNRIS